MARPSLLLFAKIFLFAFVVSIYFAAQASGHVSRYSSMAVPGEFNAWNVAGTASPANTMRLVADHLWQLDYFFGEDVVASPKEYKIAANSTWWGDNWGAGGFYDAFQFNNASTAGVVTQSGIYRFQLDEMGDNGRGLGSLSFVGPAKTGLQQIGSIDPSVFSLSPVDFADRLAFDRGTLIVYQYGGGGGWPLNDGGKVHVFTNTNAVSAAGPWAYRQTLYSPDAVYDWPSFGMSLGVSGNSIFVGANSTFRVGAHDGTGYIFTRSGESSNFAFTERWSEIPSQWAGYFSSVATLKNGLLIVSQGANGSYASYGGAFFYSLGGNGAHSKIYSFLEGSFDKWVAASAIATNMASVFMASSSTNHEIRIFGISRDNGGVPTAITTNQVLTPVVGLDSRPSQPGAMDMAEDLLAVGRSLFTTNGITNCGAVDVYRKGTNGLFSFATTITSPEPSNLGQFGHSVLLVGRTLVVASPGAPRDVSNAVGALYLYDIGADGTASFASTQRLPQSSSYTNEVFASSLARDLDTIAVGTTGNTSMSESPSRPELKATGVSGRILLYRVARGTLDTNSPPQITSPNSYTGTVGIAFSNTVTAAGSTPITFGASNLPAGLTIQANGLITGTPTAVGTSATTLTASNAYGQSAQSVTFAIGASMTNSLNGISLGTPGFTVDPGASTAAYSQTGSGLVFNGAYALGDTVGGTFATRNWSGVSTLFVQMTQTGTNPDLGFELALYNSVFDVINTYRGTTTGAGTSTLQPMTLVMPGTGVLSDVLGAQFTWLGGGTFNATIERIVAGNAASPTGDEDNDGLNNTEEANLGTNPYQRDTDNDGVNDLREVGDGTNPLNAASFESLNRGLIAYYPLNGNGSDASGFGNHAANSGAVPADDRTGGSNKALSFNGNVFLLAANIVDLPQGAQPRALSCWVRSSQVYQPTWYGYHVANWGHTDTLQAFGLMQYFGSTWWGYGHNVDTDSGVTADDSWSHLVVTYDGVSKRVFVNGALRAMRYMTLNTQGRDFYIGARTDNWAFFRGDIDDVRVYNKNLSQNDVTDLYKYEQYSACPIVGAASKSPFDPATVANWSAGGTAWTVDTSATNDGVDSVRAKTTDGQSTYREYTVTGPAVVDFWWKVSSEQLYDMFSYSLNGANQETISGEVDWTYRTLTLPAGAHTIRWTYTKDGSDAVGQDAGWLDDFAVYPATATLQVRDGVMVLNGTTTVDFGSADVGSAGFTKSLTFVNNGYVPQEVELSLPQGSMFTFDGGAATYGLFLGRGEIVAVPISLATAAAGTKSAQLTISAPGSTSTPPLITLTGHVRGPDISLAQGATTLTSGQTFDMGLAPRTVEFTVKNNGSAGNLVISAISATGNFQITQQPATSIPPQGSTTFKVLAQSIASGMQPGSISITSNAANLAEFSLPLLSKSFTGIAQGIMDGSMATSGTGGAVGWDFATTQLPSGQSGQALKTGMTPNAADSVLQFTTQTAGVVSWSWKVGSQENFDWLLCEVGGQEVAGISTKNGVWQTQVINVPAGANVRWVYRKDGSASAGEDAGYLAGVEFCSFAANQPYSQWADAHSIYDSEQRMPKSGMKAKFAWLGGFDPAGSLTAGHHVPFMEGGLLKYRFPISKTADGTQQILYSSDMTSWTTRRFSQRIVSEDASRMVVEATAPSGVRGFFRTLGLGDAAAPPLGLLDSVLVSGGGQNSLNGEYNYITIFEDKPYYVNNSNPDWFIIWFESQWQIYDFAVSALPIYYSSENTPYPWQVRQWQVRSGFGPAPNVSRGRSN